jgi:hypothetical protein
LIAGVLVIGVGLVVGCSGPATTASPSPAGSSSPTAAGSPLPSGGITEAQAIELSRSHLSVTTFTSASVGTFRDLAPPGTGFGSSDAPDRLVWAVRFTTSDVTICNPVGVCDSPQPAVATVYLDYYAGAFLMSAGFSPNPSP